MCGGGECHSVFHLLYESGQKEDGFHNVCHVQRAGVKTGVKTGRSMLVLTEVSVGVTHIFI